MIKKIKARWNDDETQRLKDMGIESEKYIIKECYVNTDRIAMIDEYEGFICIYFSGREDDILITDIEYKESNIKALFSQV